MKNGLAFTLGGVMMAVLAATAVGATSAPAVLDSSTQSFIDTVKAAGGPPIYTLAPKIARKVLDDAQSSPVEKMPASIENRIIKGGPTGHVAIRIIRPIDVTTALPAIVYLHGGGWILGNAHTHDRLVRELANGVRAAVIFVNYTPSPEARFPIANEQAYFIAKYLSEHGSELAVDPHRIAIAGDSVGGNMATVVAMMAKARGGPHFRYQALFYPVTDANFDNSSYQQFANGPWLSRKAMQWFWDAYEPSLQARTNPLESPLHAPLATLSGLPPALVITDENDVLRDEGEAYAHRLMQAGVRVTAMRYLGTCHDFVMLNGLAQTPAARSAIATAIVELRKALR